jgi:hypothetical protein
MERVPEAPSSSSASAFVGKDTFGGFAGRLAASMQYPYAEGYQEGEETGRKESDTHGHGQPRDADVFSNVYGYTSEGGRGGKAASPTVLRRARTRLGGYGHGRAAVSITASPAPSAFALSSILRRTSDGCSRRLSRSSFHGHPPPAPTPPRKPSPPLTSPTPTLFRPLPISLPRFIARHKEQGYPQTDTPPLFVHHAQGIGAVFFLCALKAGLLVWGKEVWMCGCSGEVPFMSGGERNVLLSFFSFFLSGYFLSATSLLLHAL